jgi:hypothetical protein
MDRFHLSTSSGSYDNEMCTNTHYLLEVPPT